MRIIPSITTITPGAWRAKFAEVKKLQLKEVCLFPTCLNFEERKEFYSLLKEAGVRSVPFVHLRSDMTIGEMAYLINNFQTKVFNTHTIREYPIPAEWVKYQNLIYIENTYEPFDKEEIKKFAGVCVDLSHLENDRVFRPEIYKHNLEVIKSAPCSCSHISGAKKFALLNKNNQKVGSRHPHFFDSLTEFDYLKNYPLAYLGEVAALELENTIGEQLKVKEYIINLRR